jgi:hypothetical protein
MRRRPSERGGGCGAHVVQATAQRGGRPDVLGWNVRRATVAAQKHGEDAALPRKKEGGASSRERGQRFLADVALSRAASGKAPQVNVLERESRTASASAVGVR